MLLKRSGARLPIDSLEFIDPILDINEDMTRIFFMAGVRHYLNCNGDNCENAGVSILETPASCNDTENLGQAGPAPITVNILYAL